MTSGLIGGLIAALLLSLITWIVNRRRPGRPPGTAVYYGAAMKVIAVACCAGFFAFTAFATMAMLDGNKTATLWVILLFCAFSVGSVAMAIDAFTRRIAWTRDELIFRRWNGVQRRAWSDIASIDERPLLQYEQICFRDGSGFAIFSYLNGRLDFLIELAERDIPFTCQGRAIVDDETDQPPEP